MLVESDVSERWNHCKSMIKQWNIKWDYLSRIESYHDCWLREVLKWQLFLESWILTLNVIAIVVNDDKVWDDEHDELQTFMNLACKTDQLISHIASSSTQHHFMIIIITMNHDFRKYNIISKLQLHHSSCIFKCLESSASAISALISIESQSQNKWLRFTKSDNDENYELLLNQNWSDNHDSVVVYYILFQFEVSNFYCKEREWSEIQNSWSQ